jgi:hypothetical protein
VLPGGFRLLQHSTTKGRGRAEGGSGPGDRKAQVSISHLVLCNVWCLSTSTSGLTQRVVSAALRLTHLPYKRRHSLRQNENPRPVARLFISNTSMQSTGIWALRFTHHSGAQMSASDRWLFTSCRRMTAFQYQPDIHWHETTDSFWPNSDVATLRANWASVGVGWLITRRCQSAIDDGGPVGG